MRARSDGSETSREQQEAKDSDQNREIGRKRKEGQKFGEDEEHGSIPDRRSTICALNLVYELKYARSALTIQGSDVPATA